MFKQLLEAVEPSHVITGAVCGYFLYYFYKVVHRPVLIAADGEFKSILSDELVILKEHWWPTFWAFNTHFQTITRVLFKAKPHISYKREILNTPDHGQFSLDWLDPDEDNDKFPDPAVRPTLVVLPGITGCSDASYVRTVIIEAEKMGFRALVFNNRGMGKTDLKTPRTFCACNGEDLEFVLEHVAKKYPESPLIIFAVSLGGMVLTNYMAQVGSPKARVVGALVISAPWDSFKSTASLEKPLNWLIYNRHLANNLKNIVTENLDVFQEDDQLPYKLEDVMKATSIREFDEQFTSKTFGFPSCHDYYTESSLSLKPLEKIQIPMLFLNARDDPFAPEESIPLDAIKKNPNMAIILTDYGGHIGFVEGPTIRSRSFVERLFHQYASCMLNVKH
ncbi:phospholipase ABHD3-like isoform X2 [Hydractinia symbiolongicarpus]|uniref:phospholipase ABHD3-like isoform X2 n=1 Tax=Hydractinia symbiolongicarpus TaxID=13093 RepID=UPI00254D68D6|nr:phospholipase ABHD3-like isoform X2 [Hydractinia symbiolongicarpus]